MERYTEYHAGVPVIRDKELLPGAMKRLAVLEDNLEGVMDKMCDQYCRYPVIFPDQKMMDIFCKKCKLANLLEKVKRNNLSNLSGGNEIED